MSFIQFLHTGTVKRRESRNELEIKRYAKSEGLSWWPLINEGKKKKK